MRRTHLDVRSGRVPALAAFLADQADRLDLKGHLFIVAGQSRLEGPVIRSQARIDIGQLVADIQMQVGTQNPLIEEFFEAHAEILMKGAELPRAGCIRTGG